LWKVYAVRVVPEIVAAPVVMGGREKEDGGEELEEIFSERIDGARMEAVRGG
jgi:hypothetical protein